MSSDSLVAYVDIQDYAEMFIGGMVLVISLVGASVALVARVARYRARLRNRWTNG